MKHFLIKYSYHHNVEKSVPNQIFEADNNMGPSDLAKMLKQIVECGFDEYLYPNVEADNFDVWVTQHYDVLYAWLFGKADVDERIAQELADDDLHDWVVFNIHDDYKGRNIGLSIPDGTKYETVWLSVKCVDDQLLNKIKEINSRPVSETIYELAKREIAQ